MSVGALSVQRRASPAPSRATPAARPAIMLWIGIVGVGTALVYSQHARGLGIGVDAPPLNGTFNPVLSLAVLPAVITGMALARVGSRVAASLRWRTLLWGSGAAALIWAVTLASARGWDRLADSLSSRFEYLAVLPRINDLGSFLAGYTEHLADYPIHVEGHPPGPTIALWALREVGLGGAGWGAALFVIGGAAAVPAVLVAAREVGGEHWARRAAPFVVLAPVAIWVATSADALFSGIATWGAALVIVGTQADATKGADRRRDLAALAGGVLLGVAIFCSYGLILIGVVPFAVAVHRRRLRPIVLGALGAGIVVLGFFAAGFWWFNGLLATRDRYFFGIGGRRSYLVFLVANLSALALALGPAVAVGIARLRPWRLSTRRTPVRGLGLLVGAGLVMVALADVSGMSKAEVERIWIPLTPWLLLAGAAVVAPPHADRAEPAPRSTLPARWSATHWLMAQAGVAIIIESLVLTPW